MEKVCRTRIRLCTHLFKSPTWVRRYIKARGVLSTADTECTYLALLSVVCRNRIRRFDKVRSRLLPSTNSLPSSFPFVMHRLCILKPESMDDSSTFPSYVRKKVQRQQRILFCYFVRQCSTKPFSHFHQTYPFAALRSQEILYTAEDCEFRLRARLRLQFICESLQISGVALKPQSVPAELVRCVQRPNGDPNHREAGGQH